MINDNVDTVVGFLRTSNLIAFVSANKHLGINNVSKKFAKLYFAIELFFIVFCAGMIVAMSYIAHLLVSGNTFQIAKIIIAIYWIAVFLVFRAQLPKKKQLDWRVVQCLMTNPNNEGKDISDGQKQKTGSCN